MQGNGFTPEALSTLYETYSEVKDTSNYVGNNRFTTISHGKLLSKEYRLKNRSKSCFLEYLKLYIVRKNYKGDLGLHKNYWKKGILACSKPMRKMADDFGYPGLSPVQNYIKQLIDDNEIIIKSVNIGNGRPQNIYILGIHNSGDKENYQELYLGDIIYDSTIEHDLNYYLDKFKINKKLIL